MLFVEEATKISSSTDKYCLVDGDGHSAVKNKHTQYYKELMTGLKSAQADSDAYLSGIIEEEKKAGAATCGEVQHVST